MQSETELVPREELGKAHLPVCPLGPTMLAKPEQLAGPRGQKEAPGLVWTLQARLLEGGAWSELVSVLGFQICWSAELSMCFTAT